MSSFKQMLIDEVVLPVLRTQARPLIGVIESYDEKTNLASVRISEPGTGVDSLFERVPVVISGGVKTAGPMPGQKVLVEFINGSYNTPMVVGLVDNAYMAATRGHSQNYQKHGILISRQALSTRQFVGW